MNKPIIKVTDLNKTFRSRGNNKIISGLFDPQWKYTKAVDDVSFEIFPGESVAFLGPNGAGKTTTTKMITGLIYPTSGDVKVLNYVPQERKRQFLSSIGLVMGNKASLNWDLTANQSFRLLKSIYQIGDNDFVNRLEQLSQLLNVGHVVDKQIRQLSLGERMKLELIGALLHQPQILFLDEPTIGLDIDSKHLLRNFLVDLQREQGLTLLLTSHDMDDIDQVCERVIVISHGKKIYDNKLSTLSKLYKKKRYIKLATVEPLSQDELRRYGSIVDQKGRINVVSVEQPDLVNSLTEISKLKDLIDVQIESVPLESIMTDLFKNNS
jgi:ABC-2 type transport system ATP-binding protein